MFRNTERSYGLVSILIHWLSAFAVMGLFAVGIWMVELTYYSSWYKTAPDLHRSVGIILFGVTLLRIIWKLVNPKPRSLAGHKSWEVKAGHFAHKAMYFLLLLIMLSGYMISTADGRGVSVFSLFEVPGFGELIKGQADLAGLWHQFAAYTLIAIVLLHMLGALKHHFIDKDSTLSRMFKFKK